MSLLFIFSCCLYIRQFRLAAGIMLSTCPFVRPSVIKLVNTIFWNEWNDFLYISVRGLWGKEMKRSSLGVRRSKFKFTWRRIYEFGRVEFQVLNINKCIGDVTKSAARQSLKLHFKKTKKIKYGEKRFSIWRMELLHPAMWHVALESWQWIHQVAAPCNVTRGSGMTCRWIRPVAAPWSVTHSFGIMTLNSPGGSTCNVAGGSGMTWHGIRPNVRRIGILHLVSIFTISPQSTCHSAPVCEILSKSDNPQQK